MRRVVVVALLCAAAPACRCEGSPAPGSPAAAAPIPPSPERDGGARPVALDLVRDLPSCALGHAGVLLDLGDPSMRAALHVVSPPKDDDVVAEHGGATWLRARTRAFGASFYWPEGEGEPSAGVYVEARVLRGAARAMSIAIDGRLVGTASLDRAGPRIVTLRPAAPFAMTPGAHELDVRLGGGPRASADPLVEIDWIHLGTGEPVEGYPAPTRADVIADAAVGGRSLRALSLRAPAFVRCTGWVPASATLEASLATAGGGEADVEARLLVDRKPPIVLGRAHVTPGAAWVPWSLPVTGLDGDGALASVELVASRASKGTRLLVGQPVLSMASPAPAPQSAPARNAVVVVLGSTAARSLAPWGGAHAVPELTRLAADGATFVAHRSTSTLPSSILATLLTGLPPTIHGVDDPLARLPATATTAQEAYRQAGIATAMFTADPTAGAAFGFARGWDTFMAHDPLDKTPATQPFDDAAAWIEAHAADRFLVVVDARGGHPPWDASPEDMKTMAPQGYLGMLEPQRAAEALLKASSHATRLKDDDRVRVWALYDHALDAHDAALGRLLGALRAAGHDADTFVAVTGDVAPLDGAGVPFVDAESLDEAALATPLVVRWPGGGPLAGRKVTAPSGPLDVARTMTEALGLPSPETFGGVDLARLAAGEVAPSIRPELATRAERLSLRWGALVLLDARHRELRLCDLSLDLACVADVRATAPLALEALRRAALDPPAPGARPFPREPAAIDERTKAALVRWGRQAPDKPSDEEH